LFVDTLGGDAHRLAVPDEHQIRARLDRRLAGLLSGPAECGQRAAQVDDALSSAGQHTAALRIVTFRTTPAGQGVDPLGQVYDSPGRALGSLGQADVWHNVVKGSLHEVESALHPVKVSLH